MQYSVTSGDVTGAAAKTILAIIGTAARRPRLIQVIIGCSGAPADNVAKFRVQQFTADGTGTGVTVESADGGDGAALCTAKQGYSAEPTYRATGGLVIPLNQRATMVYNVPVAYMPPIGAAAGIGIQMVAGPALAYNVTAIFEE
jgi:hypothetical protein